MQKLKTDHRLGSELLRFLHREDAFLSQLEECANHLVGQPAGKPLPGEFIAEIDAIKEAAAVRNLDRAKLRTELSVELLMTPSALRMSELDVGSELTQQLQNRRRQVLARAIGTYARLRIAIVQLRESNSVVTAVLEAILGEQIDRSRYDSDGKPVPQVNRLEGLRVA